MSARAWFRIHSFTGVVTGLLLFVVCWSGTFATLAHEIDWLVTPDARVDPAGAPASWAEIAQAVHESHTDAHIERMEAPLNAAAAAEVIVDLPRVERARVYVDPYSAEVLGTYSYFDVQRFFRSFHRRLFLPNPIGIYVVSLFAVALLLSMLAALSFYKRWWRRFLRFRPGRGRAVWSELHKTGGLWSLWFILLMVVTGLWYGLEATGGPDRLLAPAREAPAVELNAERRSMDALLAAARDARPTLDIRTVYPLGSFYGDDQLRVTGRGGDLLLRDRVNYATIAADGDIVATGSGADLTLYEYWVHMADPLHFGNFAGLWSKIIWFVFGLVLSGLILTGTYLHARRIANDAKGRHRWPGTWAAATASVMVLAASVPLGFDEAREWCGPTSDGAGQIPEVAAGVKAIIIGWVAATLAIVTCWTGMLVRSSSKAGSIRESN